MQARHFWISLASTVIAVLALLAMSGDGAGISDVASTLTRASAASRAAIGGVPLLHTYSQLIALVCGTAGLPHILARFYASRDGRQSRRAAAGSVALVAVSLIAFAALGALVRRGAEVGPSVAGGDAPLLMLPAPILAGGGLPGVGVAVTSLLVAGALAGIIAALAGLLVSASATISHDVLPRQDGSTTTFRLSAAAAGAIAIGLGLAADGLDVSTLATWALALAASTVFPLMTLGTWFRGLTKAGAIAGMVAGAAGVLSAATAAGAIAAGTLGVPDWLAVLAAQPAVLTVPLAFALMLVVSAATRSQVPADTDDLMLRLHAPEQLGLTSDYIEA
jgi:Na+(H+)/acetate symporter ActP